MVLHLPDARIAADAEFVTDQRRCIAEWSGERAQRLLTIILNAAADRVLDQMRQIRWPAEWVNLILFGSVCQMMSNHDVKQVMVQRNGKFADVTFWIIVDMSRLMGRAKHFGPTSII